MRFVNRLAWAAMVVGVTAAAGVAQQGTVITGGGQTTGGLNTGGLGGVTTGGQGGQGGGGQGGLGGGGGMGQGTQLQGLEPPPDITAPTGGGASVNKSNVLGAWYANPYYQGTWDASKSGTAPGGFGTALHPATGGTGAGGRGGLGTQTGRTGTQGGLGGQRAGQNTANQSGTVVPMQVQIAYSAVPGPGFRVPPMTAPQLQADVSGMFARATATLPGAANVQVITDGNVVTLRGTVADLDEARLIEGMTRLTPGVGLIRNELTFPVSQP